MHIGPCYASFWFLCKAILFHSPTRVPPIVSTLSSLFALSSVLCLFLQFTRYSNLKRFWANWELGRGKPKCQIWKEGKDRAHGWMQNKEQQFGGEIWVYQHIWNSYGLFLQLQCYLRLNWWTITDTSHFYLYHESPFYKSFFYFIFFFIFVL